MTLFYPCHNKKNKNPHQNLSEGGVWEGWKDLYQVLLGIYLCQRWIVEFKGITQPVLFMIFFSDFVNTQKRTLSEGSLGNRWFQPNVNTCKKHKPSISRPRGWKCKKIKVLYFLQLQKFEKVKWSYFVQFLPLGWDIHD